MKTIQTKVQKEKQQGENFREHQLHLGQYQGMSHMSDWLSKKEEGKGKVFEEIMTETIKFDENYKSAFLRTKQDTTHTPQCTS